MIFNSYIVPQLLKSLNNSVKSKRIKLKKNRFDYWKSDFYFTKAICFLQNVFWISRNIQSHTSPKNNIYYSDLIIVQVKLAQNKFLKVHNDSVYDHFTYVFIKMLINIIDKKYTKWIQNVFLY